MADKLYLLSPVITPSTEKENEDNLRWREGKGGGVVKTMFDVENFSS